MEKESKSPRRKRTRRLIRRFAVGLGLAVAIAPTSTTARERAGSPRRAVRATPPWFEPGGRIPPPRPLGSTEARPHPAIHGDRAGNVARLFPRAPRAGSGQARDEAPDARAESMARHPAGKARGAERVEVTAGDSLWSITERYVGRERTPECWPKLYRRNRVVIGPNPSHIIPGQTLTLPKDCS